MLLERSSNNKEKISDLLDFLVKYKIREEYSERVIKISGDGVQYIEYEHNLTKDQILEIAKDILEEALKRKRIVDIS